MATPGSVKIKIQDLITSANATTGKGDTNLRDGVYSLIQGYGSGDGSTVPTFDGSVAVEGEAQHIPYYEGEVVVS